MTNYQDIVQRYMDGEAITSIAKFYGLSKQRIHQIVKEHGEHRPSVHELRQIQEFAFFDAWKDKIEKYRGSRMNWGEVHISVQLANEEPIPDEAAFFRWRKARGFNPASGTGPEVFCGRGNKCIHKYGALQPRANFAHFHGGPDGLESTCKSCRKEYQQNHMEDYIRRNKKYLKKN